MIYQGDKALTQEDLEQYDSVIKLIKGEWFVSPFDHELYKRLATIKEIIDEMILIYRRNRGYK